MLSKVNLKEIFLQIIIYSINLIVRIFTWSASFHSRDAYRGSIIT